MSSWQESVSWTRDAVWERESAPDLVCKVLERKEQVKKGGTEVVDSATRDKASCHLGSGAEEDMS